MNDIFVFVSFQQRAAGSERQTEQLRQQLVTVNQSQREGDTTQKSADMEKAIDMLQRSGLEVELAAKEKEVRYRSLLLTFKSMNKRARRIQTNLGYFLFIRIKTDFKGIARKFLTTIELTGVGRGKGQGGLNHVIN